jgi:hypothetical protein
MQTLARIYLTVGDNGVINDVENRWIPVMKQNMWLMKEVDIVGTNAKDRL